MHLGTEHLVSGRAGRWLPRIGHDVRAIQMIQHTRVWTLGMQRLHAVCAQWAHRRVPGFECAQTTIEGRISAEAAQGQSVRTRRARAECRLMGCEGAGCANGT
eukprot:scaffold37609_cov41-Tisochrysis_lutea.AAC.1